MDEINADIEKLKRVVYAMQDVCTTEERYEWEREHLFSITSPQISDMPRGNGIKKDIGDRIVRMEDKRDQYKAASKRYMDELTEAEEILNAIHNPNMRTFVVLVYVMGMPFEEVRKRLNMTEYTFKQAKTAIENADSMACAVWRGR